jgi:hypothetical protein
MALLMNVAVFDFNTNVLIELYLLNFLFNTHINLEEILYHKMYLKTVNFRKKKSMYIEEISRDVTVK